MQLVFLTGLLFGAGSLFEDFNLAKQFFTLLAMDNLLFDRFFCLCIKTSNNSNDILPHFIER